MFHLTLHLPHRAPVALATALTLAVAAHAAPPAFEDTIAQRVQACTTCHGAQGRAGPDGYYPRLAGKPAGYLYNQLLNFRDERRRYRPMNHLLDRLPDAYLREMAEHFARQRVPYPAPQPAAAPAATLARGERLVRQGDPARQLPACVACHGAALTGLAPHVPGLLGLPRDYLNGQLGSRLAPMGFWKVVMNQQAFTGCRCSAVASAARSTPPCGSTGISSARRPSRSMACSAA